MSCQKMNSWQQTAAWLAILAVMGQPQLLLAVEAAPQAIKERMEVPRDVVLAEGGLLVGQLRNEKGAAMSMTPISLQTGGKEVARIMTDKGGKFQVKSLRGGVYSVVAQGHQGIYRFWAPQTAPPSAQKQLTLISHKEIVRGQFTPRSGNPLTAVGQFIAEHPLLTAAGVGAAIAIPLALDDDDPVPAPATP